MSQLRTDDDSFDYLKNDILVCVIIPMKGASNLKDGGSIWGAPCVEQIVFARGNEPFAAAGEFE
jgi:hypothetical protein